MEYESALGIFSPDGRLIQVEYAQNASEQGSLVSFAYDEEKISVSMEKKIMNKMIIEEPKIIPIDKKLGIWMSFSGLKPDSYLVVNQARLICRNYKYSTGEDIRLSQLASKLCDYKQGFTLDSRRRPLGLRTVLFGFEPKPKIFIVEPDGNFSEFTGGALGQKCHKVLEHFEKGMSDDVVKDTILGLVEVIQSDLNKIISFVITKEGCKEVDSSIVSDIINSTSK